jgi:cyclophilin family peptidyl-prolyl cis-trans isomerase
MICQHVKSMTTRVVVVLTLCLCAVPVVAQVVRFQTSVGDFDMVLNPTNNPRLQGHVDNMLRYVEENRYQGVWINRAAEGFVLQMGSFYAHTRRPPLTIESTRPVAPFQPVQGVPAAQISGLSNTLGTVALALPGDGRGGTDRNAGTSSFFVNLASNAFLDNDFTVFAAIPDMTVINQIMRLTQRDYTQNPSFGADPGNLAFIDVPLQDNGFQVFINRAFVVTDPLGVARARAGVQPVVAQSAAMFSGETGEEDTPLSSQVAASSAVVVPEPASMFTAATAILGLMAFWLRQSRA